ncbi:dihydroorotate dehydrogenase [Tessaracoccus coleopterorum]|uniref:hypothetical protein n=1 Tax=Tessaracoccus coleopterorum TaxID=2714950 RepID=UPI002F90A802
MGRGAGARADHLPAEPGAGGARPGWPTRHSGGVRFPNRVGLAAGLDKDGVAAQAWARFGFGFAELGTVTAQAQPGNPKPRMFRAIASRGIINRMGFNNRGAEALAQTLRDKGVERGNGALGIPLGISIGKTKATPSPMPPPTTSRRCASWPAGRLRGCQRVEPQHPGAA